MNRIPRHLIDTIRDRSDLSRVVQKRVRLVPQRGGFKGLCPFHHEKTPSFHVTPSKGLYYCYGCQAGGDVFKFLMETEGLSFLEAVRELADQAGITIEEETLDPSEIRRMNERSQLLDLLEKSAAFFETTLWDSPEGEPGRAYLTERGLSNEICRHFRVGFAPDSWNALLNHLAQEGADAEQLVRLGLARPRRDSDGHYDYFRRRLLFPICDDRGRVIAFGGRLIDGEGPKYLNTPETELYRKSEVLYGFSAARSHIVRKKRTILVEGYFDVIAMHSAGFTETVAACGTALTRQNIDKIRRFSSNVIMLFDSDRAGTEAAKKALLPLVQARMNARRLQLPDAKDPDELIREGGEEAIQRALTHSTPLLEWAIAEERIAMGTDAMASEQIIHHFLDVFKELPPEQISKVAATLHLNEGLFRQRLSALAQQAPRAPSTAVPRWRPTIEITHLLWLIIHRYDQVADILGACPPALFDRHPMIQPILARLQTGEPVASILTEQTDPDIKRTLSAVVAKKDLYRSENAAMGFCQVLHRFKQPQRDSRLAELSHKIAQSQGEDFSQIALYLAERAKIHQHTKASQKAMQSGDVSTFSALLSDAEALEEDR